MGLNCSEEKEKKKSQLYLFTAMNPNSPQTLQQMIAETVQHLWAMDSHRQYPVLLTGPVLTDPPTRHPKELKHHQVWLRILGASVSQYYLLMK